VELESCEWFPELLGNTILTSVELGQDKTAETWRELLSFKHVYREQFDALMKIAPWIFGANAFVTLFTAAMFLGLPGGQFAVGWAGLSMLVTGLSYIAYFRARNTPVKDEDIPAAARKVTILSAVRGLIWAVAFAVLMPQASPDTALFVGWVIAGLMCGGIITYWSLPLAAISFSGVVTLGGTIGIVALGGATAMFAPFVVIALYAILSRVAIWNASQLRQRVRSEQELLGKNDVIGLLLKDFEESSRDWLWEMDGDGKITRGISGFSRSLRLDTSHFALLSCVDILKNAVVSENQTLAVTNLSKLLDKQEAFGQHIVSIGEGPELAFLELSAKPRTQKDGSIIGWHGVASDVTTAKIAEARIQYMAMFDGLTGLRNRVNFQEHLGSVLTHSAVDDCWVMYLDLDGFKVINDTIGHAMGDRLLGAVAERLNGLIGPRDILARVGGDEFVLLAYGDRQEIDSLWRKIVTVSARVFEFDGHNLYIGASIGIAEVLFDGSNGLEFIRRADLALYRAKNDGRGTARFYEDEMDAVLQQRRRIERDLRLALVEDKFVLHYQPIYSFQDKKLVCYEALLRWTHDKHGSISPAVFIPIAEEAGLISELGNWALRRACKDAMNWPKDVQVAVNVSSLQLKTRRFLSDVTNALADSGLPASRLELELTESALVENADIAGQMIADLKALGVHIALDDFGTGYSSLSYLHKFQFDKIKIDRSFVQAYELRKESAAVVNAVLMLARDLGIATTAEGVETTTQFEALAAVGCDQVQGFLLGRPEPVKIFDADDRMRHSSGGG
jgi:diguanylate cyclase (GGDEF)-like protein